MLGGGVEADQGLIEEQQVGFLGEGAGDQHAPLLAAGELADLAASEVGKLDLFQCGRHGLAVGVAGAAQEADAAIAAHHDDIADSSGKVPIDDLRLGRVADATADRSDGLAEELDAAAPGFEQAEERLDQGGLSGAVRPGEADERALGQVEAEGLEGGCAVVAGPEVVDGDGGNAGL